jgi:hypothetical protein
LHRTSHHVPTLVFLNTHPETSRYLALCEAWTVLPVLSDHMIHHSSRLWLTLRPEQANKHLIQCLSLFSVRRVQTPFIGGGGRERSWLSAAMSGGVTPQSALRPHHPCCLPAGVRRHEPFPGGRRMPIDFSLGLRQPRHRHLPKSAMATAPLGTRKFLHLATRKPSYPSGRQIRHL